MSRRSRHRPNLSTRGLAGRRPAAVEGGEEVMALMAAHGFTLRQRTLRDLVCARARTLHDRLRALQHYAWQGANPADVTVVREWLLDIHRDDGATRPKI